MKICLPHHVPAERNGGALGVKECILPPLTLFSKLNRGTLIVEICLAPLVLAVCTPKLYRGAALGMKVCICVRAGVAERYTRWTQNPLPARAWGFKSLLRQIFCFAKKSEQWSNRELKID